ncbi:MAG: multidrug effflux MFS transporter, partial [Burkholderiales bacterium]|nr:multidrug effflux MFS transporter [Burkholderiales bacterium]
MVDPRRPQRHHTRLLPFLLAALATLGPFSIDTYMPSFPAMGIALAASPLQVQQTLTSYLVAFAVMMLFHGALSDAFGRRPVVLVSLVIYTGASLGCAYTTDITALLVLRALQGVAAGAGLVIGRAMIRDLYAGAEAQQLMSRVTMIFGIAPAIAPIIGGWLHTWFGWRSIFIFLAWFGALLFAFCARYLPETLPHTARERFHPKPLFANYRKVGTHPEFQLLSLAIALNFAGFFLYIAAAPVFVIEHLHLGEHQFGWLFIPAVSGIVLGAYLSGRMAGRCTLRATVRYAYFALFAGAILNLFYNFATPPALPWAVLLVALYSAGMSLAMPSISLLNLELYPRNRGMVSS